MNQLCMWITCLATLVTLGIIIAIFLRQKNYCKKEGWTSPDNNGGQDVDCGSAPYTLKHTVSGSSDKCLLPYQGVPWTAGDLYDCMYQGALDYWNDQGVGDVSKTWAVEYGQAVNVGALKQMPKNWWLPTAQGGMC